jgi:RNA polymerase sigma-70 factor, ECF subfamily
VLSDGGPAVAAEAPGDRQTHSEDVVARAYAAEAGRLVSLGRMLCGDAQAGEDLAHDVFVEAVRRTRDDPGYLREPVWPWLRVAMVHRATRWRHRRMLELRSLVRTGAPPAAEAWSPATVDTVRAVRALPSRMRACVALFYVEDMSTEQIAEVLGCSPRTVETQLRLARRRLASLLQDPNETPQEGR